MSGAGGLKSGKRFPLVAPASSFRARGLRGWAPSSPCRSVAPSRRPGPTSFGNPRAKRSREPKDRERAPRGRRTQERARFRTRWRRRSLWAAPARAATPGRSNNRCRGSISAAQSSPRDPPRRCAKDRPRRWRTRIAWTKNGIEVLREIPRSRSSSFSPLNMWATARSASRASSGRALAGQNLDPALAGFAASDFGVAPSDASVEPTANTLAASPLSTTRAKRLPSAEPNTRSTPSAPFRFDNRFQAKAWPPSRATSEPRARSFFQSSVVSVMAASQLKIHCGAAGHGGSLTRRDPRSRAMPRRRGVRELAWPWRWPSASPLPLARPDPPRRRRGRSRNPD